jgi:hypothetical protein
MKVRPNAAIEVVHQVDELRGVVRVQVGGGLVGQHQRGPMDDGAGNRYALTLAAGEQVGAMIGAGRETDLSRASATRLTAFTALTPWTSSGNSTFSAAVKTGMRLKV